MKRALLYFIPLFYLHANAQTNSFPPNGSAGIGTTSPTHYEHGGINKVLEIKNEGTGTHSQSHLILSTNSVNPNSSIGSITWAVPAAQGTKGVGFIAMSTSTNSTASNPTGQLYFATRSASDPYWMERMRLSEDGNLGIGTQAPLTRLHVNSQNIGIGSANWIAGNFGGTGGDRVVMGILYGKATIGAHSNSLNSWSNLVINPEGGLVGIGTLNPTEMLSVKGKIRAHEIKVENQNWPDYVFSSSHKKPSLSELESYIKANNHLPEIPSAKEAETDGISLGEMNKKLLQKIEELTLYAIDQNKGLESYNKKLEEQQELIQALQKEVQELKKHIK